MNHPTAYQVIAFKTSRKNKVGLIKYTRITGTTIKHVMDSLLTKFLDEQLDKNMIEAAKRD